ncbi:MAG TPA: hypothetical protein VFD88_03580 [Clostridia bacterium]|nr:hypothetical protein [Clostridia bacterium]
MATGGQDAPEVTAKQIPDGSWVSADNRWLWRDSRWQPMPAAGPPGWFWFVSTPGWLPTLLVIGLIGLIPIAGVMNIYGYTIFTARNLRAGYHVLPPANLSYIGLGAPVAVLTLAWSLIAVMLAMLAGLVVGLATYAQSHSLPWTAGLAVPTFFTVLALANLPNLPLFVPALEMSDREGWGIFRIGRLLRHVTQHWRSAWYGAAVVLLWYAMYLAIVLILSAIPFGSILAALVGLPVLAAMVAVPIARFSDPPAGFGKGAANTIAAGWLVFWMLAMAVPWAIGVAAASFVSSHPDQVACVFEPGCFYSTSGNGDAIAKVTRDAQDPTLVTVEVTYINTSGTPAEVNPADYSARTGTGEILLPSSDCAAPAPATVAPGTRLTQQVCFRLPAAADTFDVHLPWIGWDYNTP